MDLQIFKPRHELLRKHIDYFYLLKKSENSDTLRYYTFPQVNSIVSINRCPEFTFGENRLTVTRSEANPLLATVICNYKRPIEVNIPGYINEITISFKPLGLNAFLSNSLHTYTNNYFNIFNPYEDFLSSMIDIMDSDSMEDKSNKLETYLLDKYKGFTHPFLYHIVGDIMNNEVNCTIEELARRYKISRKTLCKHFEMHIGKTPSDLRKVFRFRQSLQQWMSKSPKNNLSDITYELNFFDQSHLIKDFKAMTGYAPKAFFEKLNTHQGGNVNWLYL